MCRVVDSPGSRAKAEGSTRASLVRGVASTCRAVSPELVATRVRWSLSPMTMYPKSSMPEGWSSISAATPVPLSSTWRLAAPPSQKALEAQGAAAEPASRGREGDAHRQGAQAVGGQQVLPVRGDLREDGEVAARRVDAADGEVGVAAVGQLDDAAARLAHGYAAEVEGRGPELQEAARPLQPQPLPARLRVDEQDGLPEADLLRTEGELHPPALPRVEQERAALQAELRAAAILQLQAHHEGAAASVPHQQRHPGRLAHGHAAEVDGRAVQELHLRGGDLAQAAEGDLEAGALRIVAAEQQNGAGRSLVAGVEAPRRHRAGPRARAGGPSPRRPRRPRGRAAGVRSRSPRPWLIRVSGRREAAPTSTPSKSIPTSGRGETASRGASPLAGEGHRRGGQVRGVHLQPAPEGAVARRPEEHAHLDAGTRRQPSAGTRRQREGPGPGLDGQTVDDELHPAGVGQLQGAAHDPPHGGRAGVEALPGGRAAGAAGDARRRHRARRGPARCRRAPRSGGRTRRRRRRCRRR